MTSQEESGLFALVLLLRLHGVAAEDEQLCHRLGARCVGITEMLRCAKDFGLKARLINTSWARLARTPLPAIAALKDGGFLLLGKAEENAPSGQADPR
jgi:subfamily B ATP-binding cassette protein HlyB/CyaB